MSKIIFVIGIPGAGKSTYIRDRYLDEEKYCVIDMAAESVRSFGNLEPLKDEDYGEDRLTIINSMTDKGFFALLDGKDLVVEHNVVGEDLDELFDLVQKANVLGFHTEWIHLHVEQKVAQMRIQSAGDAYFFSEALALDVLMVLGGILEDYQLNVQLEELAEFKGPSGRIQLFKKDEGEGSYYFFVEERSYYSGFKSIEDLQGEGMGGCMVLYNDFKGALGAIFEQYEFDELYLVSVKQALRPVLEKFLAGKRDVPYWEKFLN